MYTAADCGTKPRWPNVCYTLHTAQSGWYGAVGHKYIGHNHIGDNYIPSFVLGEDGKALRAIAI